MLNTHVNQGLKMNKQTAAAILPKQCDQRALVERTFEAF